MRLRAVGAAPALLIILVLLVAITLILVAVSETSSADGRGEAPMEGYEVSVDAEIEVWGSSTGRPYV